MTTTLYDIVLYFGRRYHRQGCLPSGSEGGNDQQPETDRSVVDGGLEGVIADEDAVEEFTSLSSTISMTALPFGWRGAGVRNNNTFSCC